MGENLMNIREREKYYFSSTLNEIINEKNFDGENARMHIPRESIACYRITLYSGGERVTKHISFSNNFSLSTLSKIVLKEFPETFKHVKRKRDRWGNPSVCVY